ncbi:MarR family winged helix-turn-helix transcriptional regulator [Paenibacillus sp. PAMC21692]|uniref:MarR family winged helix-turn-helix transcriptional regulator n=1 Tax=Paenibacillus sp. PAMC21692 TaxID=2762320 RepID=UPI00164E7C96|nr:MarR family transcriptional regulator [Paenibacillus sp. PAMC21692]QNK57351.1 MarR family transcriptional regulator [Paenibacillus sp. PAMC21692]
MNTDHPKAIDVIHILMRSTYFIQREFQSQLTAFDTPFPLTGPRLRLLSVVAETGKIRMNELAAKLGIKARTVTDFVDALEQDKLLVRIPDPTDRRATLIQLTELAQSNIEQALVYQDKIANKVLENLSVEQQKLFFELLLQLIKDKDISDTCEEAKK